MVLLWKYLGKVAIALNGLNVLSSTVYLAMLSYALNFLKSKFQCDLINCDVINGLLGGSIGAASANYILSIANIIMIARKTI